MVSDGKRYHFGRVTEIKTKKSDLLFCTLLIFIYFLMFVTEVIIIYKFERKKKEKYINRSSWGIVTVTKFAVGLVSPPSEAALSP